MTEFADGRRLSTELIKTPVSGGRVEPGQRGGEPPHVGSQITGIRASSLGTALLGTAAVFGRRLKVKRR